MIQIHTKNISIGMYVSSLDRAWEETPFLLQGFRIENEKQIRKLRQLCQHVEIDETKSDKSLMLNEISAERLKKFRSIPAEENDLPNDIPVALEQLSQSNPSEIIVYDPYVALEFFKAFGEVESVEQNVTLFSEGEKANRLLWQYNKMYLLVKGKVSIWIAGKNVGVIKTGQIFGELTPLILSERSASAVTDSYCKLISLDEKQFVKGLEQKPEFALMLMGLLIKRLRQAAVESKSLHSTTENKVENKVGKNIHVFNSSMMRELVQKIGDSAITYVLAQQTIFRKGGTGMLMYVILKGHTIASIDDKIVERSGPGCVIGEIALFDQKQRMARVVAETDVSLLAINRQIFIELVKTQPAFSLSLLKTLASRLRFCRTGELPQNVFNIF